MTKELDAVKITGVPPSPTVKNKWRSRWSQKFDKINLLNLQSSLQSEMQAKKEISRKLKQKK